MSGTIVSAEDVVCSGLCSVTIVTLLLNLVGFSLSSSKSFDYSTKERAILAAIGMKIARPVSIELEVGLDV